MHHHGQPRELAAQRFMAKLKQKCHMFVICLSVKYNLITFSYVIDMRNNSSRSQKNQYIVIFLTFYDKKLTRFVSLNHVVQGSPMQCKR